MNEHVRAILLRARNAHGFLAEEIVAGHVAAEIRGRDIGFVRAPISTVDTVGRPGAVTPGQ